MIILECCEELNIDLTKTIRKLSLFQFVNEINRKGLKHNFAKF